MNTNNWRQILSKSGCGLKQVNDWSPYFAKYCKKYGIDTPYRISAFLANIMVESCYLRVLRENLRYSAKGLARTWPNRYGGPNKLALSIAGNPVKIANNCYAGRMGNGDEASGDGWRYSGKGPIQITGKTNTINFFKSIGLQATDENINKLTEPDLGTRSAMWFWCINNINNNADKNDFDGCCDKINIGHKTRQAGDAHGFNARNKIYKTVLDFINKNPKLLEYSEETVKTEQTEEEIKKVIPPDITTFEEDPDNEYGDYLLEAVNSDGVNFI